MIRRGLIRGPWTTGKHAPICAYDQARVVVGILDNPEAHCGKVYPLFGSLEYSYPEIAKVLSRVLGKNIRYEHIDFDSYWKGIVSQARKSRAQHAAASLYDELERSPDAEHITFSSLAGLLNGITGLQKPPPLEPREN
jgi:NAD(P)H dehydrogenase (quinone)